MKSFRLLATVLIASFAFASAAHATTVNFAGTDYNMNLVANGQSGSVSTASTPVGFGTAYDLAQGTLGAGSEITFSYAGLPSGIVAGSASFQLLATQYFVSSTNGSAAATAQTAFGPVSVSASTLPVLVTSSINFAAGTATTTIENLTSSTLSFASYFLGLTSSSTGIAATYNVAAVPLPSALVLFASALIAMAGFSLYKKRSV